MMSNKKETWKPIMIDGKKPKIPYFISNHGHFGVLVNGKVEQRSFKPTSGYYRYNTKQQGENKSIFLHKEVAKAFLSKPSKKHTFIIHKDHNYLNDHADNLKWTTQKEHRSHTILSPNSILAREKRAITKSTQAKLLNEKSVATLKKMIWDPKRKLSFSQLAVKFGVSEMQIYRLKSGKFWYHVKVENEPIHPKYKQNLSNISYQEKRTQKEKAEKEKAALARTKIVKLNEDKRAKLKAVADKNKKAAATEKRRKEIESARAAKKAKPIKKMLPKKGASKKTKVLKKNR